jgi:hypothetical protein
MAGVPHHQIKIACFECAAAHTAAVCPDVVVGHVLLQNRTYFVQIAWRKIEAD